VGGGGAYQGWSVALSADGNTALVGGPDDNSYAGAAWVFTRTSGTWSQQGSKLVGTGAINGLLGAYQGWSVALSADGNTALVGGYQDSSSKGAAWVYTRTNGDWSQQGSKLVGTGYVGSGYQGCSVALSADGNTAILGGYGDNSTTGAAWVFIRTSGTWSQQGSKLVGTGPVGGAAQGYSVALSSDGNKALVGGPYDNPYAGASWVFTRASGTWSQQGSKLVGTGSFGSAEQGYSVALSADGNTALVGGPSDNWPAGAAWVFTTFVLLDAKAFLEGPYGAGSMSTDLNTAGVIPLAQPYSGAPWNYAGTESVSSIPANVVDWVLAELRTGNPVVPPMTKVARRAAFLKSDGTVVDLDGTSPISFSAVSAGSYYIVIRHRNHLGIMSAGTVALSSTSVQYDFTTAMTQAYGTNPMKLVSTKYVMYAGDGNNDGVINATDRNLIWRVQNGTVGYLTGDFNLDRSVNATDRNLFWRINNGKSGSLPARRVQGPPRVESAHAIDRGREANAE
jgi:hypothetical protein